MCADPVQGLESFPSLAVQANFEENASRTASAPLDRSSKPLEQSTHLLPISASSQWIYLDLIDMIEGLV